MGWQIFGTGVIGMIFSGARRFELLLAGARGRAVLALAAASVLGCFGVLAPAAGAATSVTCGDTISTPGTYVLGADCGPAGITITSSNVTLELNGHTMTGTDTSAAGVGVLVDDRAGPVSGVKVLGPGTITDYVLGVRLGNFGGGLSDSTVSGLTADNRDSGIRLASNANNNSISGNTADNNPTGIVLNGNGNTAHGNTADNNNNGISIGGTGNKVNANIADNNNGDGIALLSSSATANSISGNTADNNNVAGIFLGSEPTGNTINANTANTNGSDGIQLESGATGNTINGNTALDNSNFDLFDGNPGCDSNKWNRNAFTNANQTCIH